MQEKLHNAPEQFWASTHPTLHAVTCYSLQECNVLHDTDS